MSPKVYVNQINIALFFLLLILIFFYQLFGHCDLSFLMPFKGVRLALLGAVASMLMTNVINRYEKEKKWKKLKNLTLGELNNVIFAFLLSLIQDFQCKPSNYIKNNRNADFDKAFDAKNNKNLLEIFDGFQKCIQNGKGVNVQKLSCKDKLQNYLLKQYESNFSKIQTLIIPNLINYGEYHNFVEKLLIIQMYELEINQAIKDDIINSGHLAELLRRLKSIYELNEPKVIEFNFLVDGKNIGIFEPKKKNVLHIFICYLLTPVSIFLKKKKFIEEFKNQTDEVIKLLEKYQNIINNNKYDYDNPKKNADREITQQKISNELKIFENYCKTIKECQYFIFKHIDHDQFRHFTAKFNKVFQDMKELLEDKINNPNTSYGIIDEKGGKYYLERMPSFSDELIYNQFYTFENSIVMYIEVLKELNRKSL